MNLLDAYYEAKFEAAFYCEKGDAFQTFFERLMGLAHKADFMACRPWGNQGDRKNDGYLKSERRLFQVYAPYEMDAAKAKAKINEDFEGAKEHWKKHFDSWVFVHNAYRGLPPHVQQLLLDFEAVNPGISIQPWCLDELRLVFRKLSDDDNASWFGLAPTEETKTSLGFADLKVVLERIAALSMSPTAVKDVPAGKIEANALSEAVTRLIKEGMIKAPLVADFLAQWHDETLGERLAEAFRAEYQRLRDDGYVPNNIFPELQSWAGGGRRGSPEHELAVLTVMAYFFGTCDIFEEPRGAAR